ncbi:hypothetical protein CPB85DRAFT_1513604 [Mucidula mucida]|nr:hypothetical protein CPB85DRAFT_1513604 [Mucidula mucida]
MPAATQTSSPLAIPSPADLKAAMHRPTARSISQHSLLPTSPSRDQQPAPSLLLLKKRATRSHRSWFRASCRQVSRRQKSPAAREGAGCHRPVAKSGAVKALEPIFAESGIYAAFSKAFRRQDACCPDSSRRGRQEFVAAMNPWATALIFPPFFTKTQNCRQIGRSSRFPRDPNQLVKSAPVSDGEAHARDYPRTLRVDSPTLSNGPPLSRGLSEKLTSTKRKVAVVSFNLFSRGLSRHRPTFSSQTLPGLIKVEGSIGDPEARGVVGKAIATLRQVGEVPEGDGSDLPPLKVADTGSLGHSLTAVYKKLGSETHVAHVAAIYASSLAANLVNAKNFDVPDLDSRPISVSREWVVRSATEDVDEGEALEDEEEGEDLCNCQFSLAYGAKILLNTATLRLKRGHRYGLCVTLMRAITNGFVSLTDDVRTFYVEHDIDGSEEDTSVLSFILTDKHSASVGFNDERQQQAIGSLADILLLDEPTNHLDVVNVAWLEGYLTNLKTCTSIIVSHDSSFLNNTITDVLHLNRFKLRRYRGNLEKFVAQVQRPRYRFKLPDPPLLEGVKTKEKSLLKMRKVGFQYPTQPVQQLFDITLQVSLSSRVAVLGPTVPLLIGDMEPNKGGEIWKHPNLVIGYVAQHAFHHIDNHLDKTPLEYMLWRYQTGEDLEEMTKANRQISEEEMQKMKDGGVVVIEGQKRLIDEIVARKKLKQSYEYEVSFKGLSSSENVWLPRDDLIKRGFEKKVLEVDTREAQRLGLLRPLVRREIEKHFADFGLEPEFVSHNTMRGLSGGQKVKIVLGAATWRRPHVMCLDEPTNYLDRESLAALIEALKVFEGGVLSLCKEVWAMRDGRLEASGHNWKDGDEEDQYDAMGNKIENKKQKKITAAEARKLKKERMARKKRGEEITDDEL